MTPKGKMGFYSLTFSLDSSVQQTEAIDLLKNHGFEVIQTSSGLCAKGTGSIEEIKDILGCSQISIEALKREAAISDPNLSTDVKRFMGS